MVEPTLCRIANPDNATRVEPRVMDVLVALAERAGEMVSRDELIRAVWKHPHVTDEALTRCVSLLRHALGDDRDRPRFLETIPKRGYRLLQAVTAMSSTSRTVDAPISLAVLPILNLSGDPADEYLADGTTELLIANLARMPGLRVISRTSSMHYKGTTLRLTDIARELGVARILEGSVLRSANELQIVIQLIDPATDVHLLSRSYMREFVDLLHSQNEIALTIAEEIGATLWPVELERCAEARAIGERAL